MPEGFVVQVGRYLIGYDPGDHVNREATVVIRIEDDGSFTVIDEQIGDIREPKYA